MRKVGEPSGLREKILEALRTGTERRAARLFERSFAAGYSKSAFDRTLRRMAADGLIGLYVRREFDGVYNRAFPRGGTSAVRMRRYIRLLNPTEGGGAT